MPSCDISSRTDAIKPIIQLSTEVGAISHGLEPDGPPLGRCRVPITGNLMLQSLQAFTTRGSAFDGLL